jgi:Flp pilus assembly protein TadG
LILVRANIHRPGFDGRQFMGVDAAFRRPTDAKGLSAMFASCRFAVHFIRRFAARLGADEAGAAFIEAAIALPILTLVLGGTAEFGINYFNKSQLQSAVNAGAQYALRNPTDTAGSQAAITSALPATVTGVTTTATFACECNNGTAVSCTTGTCTSGTVRKIMTLTATRNTIRILSNMQAYTLPTSVTVTAAVSVQ